MTRALGKILWSYRLLGGQGVVVSRIINVLARIATMVALRIAPFVATHVPPSRPLIDDTNPA